MLEIIYRNLKYNFSLLNFVYIVLVNRVSGQFVWKWHSTFIRGNFSQMRRLVLKGKVRRVKYLQETWRLFKKYNPKSSDKMSTVV